MISAVILFIVYVIVFGILFYACDMAVGAFLPAELVPKAHTILVLLFLLLLVVFILSLVGAVAVPFPGLHPYHL